METRTAQGAIAWAISLNTFPYIAVPAYWVFGRTEFRGYIKKRQEQLSATDPFDGAFIERVDEAGLRFDSDRPRVHVLQHLTKLPATIGNEVELLRNGEEIFPSIFAGIAAATDYVLLQLYIVRDDELGREMQDRLRAAAARGVRVYLLYDEIGSFQLPRGYFEPLRADGVDVRAFHSTQGRANRFQINFRNHRKIVVVDGRTAWVGGANLGDEYMGRNPRWSPWIDTMVRIVGPAVQAVQAPFLEDWYWATGEIVPLEWTPQPAPSGASLPVLVVPTGPADLFETCEIQIEVHDAGFAREVEALFLRDFAASRLSSADELEARSFFVRLAARVARLTAPVQ